MYITGHVFIEHRTVVQYAPLQECCHSNSNSIVSKKSTQFKSGSQTPILGQAGSGLNIVGRRVRSSLNFSVKPNYCVSCKIRANNYSLRVSQVGVDYPVHSSTQQRTAVHSSAQQWAPAHSRNNGSTQQCTAVMAAYSSKHQQTPANRSTQHYTVHSSTQQHTPAHTSTQQHTPAHSSTRQHTAAHSSTQQQIVVHRVTQQYVSGATK